MAVAGGGVPAGAEAGEAAEAAGRRRGGGDGGGREVGETATTVDRSRGERCVAALAADTARLVSHIHEGDGAIERWTDRETAVTRLAACCIAALALA